MMWTRPPRGDAERPGAVRRAPAVYSYANWFRLEVGAVTSPDAVPQATVRGRPPTNGVGGSIWVAEPVNPNPFFTQISYLTSDSVVVACARPAAAVGRVTWDRSS